ncbi:MAG TPA: ATP-binding cassette domain-containing protein, partial [Solirubrobacterales bacterium]|nr:ATP-binding cassette domain-containing protein [Solirubrobacterales bacterium]
MAIDDLASTLDHRDNRATGESVVRARGVNVFRWSTALRRRVMLLEEIEWRVDRGQHWVMLGPNGAGKTTLLHLAAADSHPSEGTVEVLGKRLGNTDMRA